MMRIILATLAIILFGTVVMGEDKKESPQQEKSSEKAGLKYLLYLPKGYDKAKKKHPMILFLHGAGERGDNLNQVKKHGPPKLVEKGRDLAFVVVSPQCPRSRWWDVKALTQLLDEVVASYNVDESRIYLTGLSMGGFGTWSLAAEHPKRFAAIAPICGGGKTTWAKKLKDVPIWVFHGGKDGVVPAKRSKDMVAALKEQGSKPKLTIYPNAGHDSWTKSYANPELYKWFLSHSTKK